MNWHQIFSDAFYGKNNFYHKKLTNLNNMMKSKFHYKKYIFINDFFVIKIFITNNYFYCNVVSIISSM